MVNNVKTEYAMANVSVCFPGVTMAALARFLAKPEIYCFATYQNFRNKNAAANTQR